MDQLFAEYQDYLKSWPAVVNEYRRTFKFWLVLENLGTAPADDVDVQLWTDARGRWLEKPELPALPRGIPRKRDPLARIGLSPYLPSIPDLGIRSILANEDGPNLSGEGSDQRVQYSVKRVKHHVPCELSEVYFRFDADDAVGSFTISVRLVAANIRKPKTDALHVEVVRKAAAAPPPPPEPDEESEN